MRLAIMGAGGIASCMANTVNGMKDVELYAVASRSIEKAESFAAKYGAQRAYGSYEELAGDSAVDLVYIATPHSEHYENARLCILHGRPVLCEKAFTANALQAAKLLALAEEKKVFITEAIWPRYMPMLSVIKDTVDSGIIGRVTSLTANLGYAIDQVPRLRQPELAGGALLDVGVYTLHFAYMMFGSDYRNVSSVCTYTETGVDEQNSITLVYEDGRTAVLNSSMLCISDRKGILYGTEGFIVIENINNFESMRVYNNRYEEIRYIERPKQLTGYEYEVEACSRALAEGKLECVEIPHTETLKVMELMDTLRRDWGIRYPFE